ncbi:hypothetical protein [Acrocarpospora macrocephala]|uniref:hypothetical protein n=1 Tax=Acrocarpospora macrocephala TaxID=150177 RepID=UPI0012D33D37
MSGTVLAMPGLGPVSAPWLPLVFGTPYVHFGIRAAPKIAKEAQPLTASGGLRQAGITGFLEDSCGREFVSGQG